MHDGHGLSHEVFVRPKRSSARTSMPLINRICHTH
jgi:hypothetical protein